jgi:hypothetical protein
MKDISVKALAKINLGLDVVRKREDGYHEVRMVMQTIHLFDRLEISKNTSGEITMETNLSFLPTNENNLVYKAAKLLQDEFAEAFDDGDVLFFTDIYAASEDPIPGIDGHLIPKRVGERLPEKEIHYIPHVEDMAKALYDFIRPGDMVITMGAGSIYRAGEELVRLIKEKGMPSDH